jgi:hypothetical protein
MHNESVCLLSSGLSTRRTLADWREVQGPCFLEAATNESDVHILVREENNIRYNFQPSTGVNTLRIADANGVVITSGNTYDMIGEIGLAGDDNMAFLHKKTSRPYVELDENLFKDPLRPNMTRSFLRGKAHGFNVWGCERLTGCNVTASASIDDDTLDQLIQVGIFMLCVCVCACV